MSSDNYAASPDEGWIGSKIERLRLGGKPRVVDLFAGCGGFSLGFERAGFEIWAGIEIDPEAASSHAVNFHGASIPGNHDERICHARDIAQLDPEDLVAEKGSEDPKLAVDVLIGGPPCQSYARVGRAKLREVADHPEAYRVDPRGNLYLRYLHYVHVLRPLAIVMENVPDVLNYGGHNVAEETAEYLDELGYDCRYTLLNAVHYGVPQMRERMFLIAYHRSLKAAVRFPDPTHFWKLPRGYGSSRNVALKHVQNSGDFFTESRFEVPPQTISQGRKSAATVKQALGDLPQITGHKSGKIKRGIRRLTDLVPYSTAARTSFAKEMRNWPGMPRDSEVSAHVIRSLPRDYKIFKRMKHGDQYPEAHALANKLFEAYVAKCSQDPRRAIVPGSADYEDQKSKFVPPYDPTKFPNKWRKIAPGEPARTVMAHLGKDSYSHIHYDCNQARTISVREAARLQSFPDRFFFVGAMNAAFRQIGNAVPPLLAYHIAETIMSDAFASMRETDRANTQDRKETVVEPITQTI